MHGGTGFTSSPARWILFCLALLPLGACDVLGLGEDRWEEEGRRLVRHLAFWEAHQPERYEYVYRVGCFCPPEQTASIRITIYRGEMESAMYAEDVRFSFDPDSVLPAGSSVVEWVQDGLGPVERLFDTIERAIEDRFEKIEVEYDGELGYPKQFVLNPCTECPDAGSVHTVTELRPLP